ncbi:DUF3786 domain-containing protein [Treponema primitia]|uniref:DUF3786 domain-containing protein n=1 Tax=Treponema primitia TaxID=88058 RepID=UPI00025552B3|nr:DUF3786 domain-containing protein [Treponema primitia]
MERGYVKTCNWVVSLLNNCDFSDSAKRLGLEQISENAVLINFFDRTYKVSKDNIELINQKTIWTTASEGYEYDLKSVLGYYVLSDANIEPLYEYCALGQFSGGVFRESSGMASMANKKFADIFSNDYEKLKKIMNMFGIEYEEGNRDGKYSWNYKILPKIPIKLVFYEGDDEFPSKLQMLYDKNAIKIYNFEQLAVLHGIITQTILSLGKS